MYKYLHSLLYINAATITVISVSTIARCPIQYIHTSYTILTVKDIGITITYRVRVVLILLVANIQLGKCSL